MYRYLNKLIRSNLKFYIALLKLYISSSEFRRTLNLQDKLKNSASITKNIRLLLKLRPAWGKAHFILGLLAYESYLDTKDAYYLGVLEISIEALRVLSYDQSAINTLSLSLDFLRKQYEKINQQNFEDLLSKPDSSAKSYLEILRLELIGSSYLAEDKREEAKSIFSKIHPDKRSQEVRVAFLMFEAIPSQLS
jgi:hypothetical protein